MKILILFLSFFLMFFKFSFSKQVKLTNTNLHYIKSKQNGIDYKIYIQLPVDYKYDIDKKYPVLYLLDADKKFPLENYNKNAIIVGIGYKGQDLSMKNKDLQKSYSANRQRDYLPIYMTDLNYPDRAEISGEAEKFKDFIKLELMLFINKNYRSSGENILYGHSFGGLFGAWVLLNYPEMFDKYIILSPSLWYENNYIFSQIEKIKDIKSKKTVYFAVGGNENKEFEKFNHFMIDDLRKFYEKIKENQNIISKMDIIEDEWHVSMESGAKVKGLRFVFSKEL